MPDLEKAIVGALELRARNGRHRHMHHSQCIHNLTPDEQIELRRRRFTREEYIAIVGMPVQITPEEWEIDPPNLLGEGGSKPGGSENG